MKLSISNIALPPYHHAAYFPTLIDLGIEGLEVATSRVWQHSLRDVTLHEVEIYRKQLEQAELEVVGLHSLLFGEKNCSLFDSPEHFSNIVAHFNKLISVCSHLGGHTMIFGAGRRRGLIPYERAYDVTRSFLDRILPDLEKNNICLLYTSPSPRD